MNPHTHKGYYALNVARLPFRHFGTYKSPSFDPLRTDGTDSRRVLMWWAIEDLNLGPLACEASALTAELIALTFPGRPHRRNHSGPINRPMSTALSLNSRRGNDRVRTCDLALMKRPLYR